MEFGFPELYVRFTTMTFVGTYHLLQQTGSVLYGLLDYAVAYKYIAVVRTFL
jgi:hypothetical protein